MRTICVYMNAMVMCQLHCLPVSSIAHQRMDGCQAIILAKPSEQDQHHSTTSAALQACMTWSQGPAIKLTTRIGWMLGHLKAVPQHCMLPWYA